MNQEPKELWLERLRSGRDKQGRMGLRSFDDKLCCLGVLCEIAVELGVIEEPVLNDGSARYHYEGATCVLPVKVKDWAGLNEELPRAPGRNLALSTMNDDGFTFEEIANEIERYY